MLSFASSKDTRCSSSFFCSRASINARVDRVLEPRTASRDGDGTWVSDSTRTRNNKTLASGSYTHDCGERAARWPGHIRWHKIPCHESCAGLRLETAAPLTTSSPCGAYTKSASCKRPRTTLLHLHTVPGILPNNHRQHPHLTRTPTHACTVGNVWRERTGGHTGGLRVQTMR
jgi:hypothetical protein